MKQLRILIVDDDEAIRFIVGQILAAEGYLVETAASGDEAVEVCDRERFDLVLSDLVMPGMDGIELILALRVKLPSVRVIAMSGGLANQNYLPLAVKIGAACALAKPFGRTALLEAVEAVLDRSEAMSA